MNNIELLFSHKSDINEILDDYEQTKNYDNLITSLKNLCIDEESEIKAKETDNINIDQLSSPGDAAIMRMKKRKKHREPEPMSSPSGLKIFGNKVEMCEEGLSPKITFTRKNYRKDSESDS